MGLAIILSDSNFATANLGKVTIQDRIEIIGLSINESSVSGIEAQLTLTYTPLNTTQKGVVWSIVNGEQYASIDGNTGLLTIKKGASSNNVVIKAISKYDGIINTEKTISVTYQEGSTGWKDITSKTGTTLNYMITRDAYQASIGDGKTLVIPLEDGVTKVLVQHSTLVTQLGFLKTIPPATTNQGTQLSSYVSAIYIASSAGMAIEKDVPSDANYMYVRITNGANENIKPDVMKWYVG